tara:strand:- start:782 stop:931 length:150 start_codon:yes stop_codon:yes gene_type:complete
MEAKVILVGDGFGEEMGSVRTLELSAIINHNVELTFGGLIYYTYICREH